MSITFTTPVTGSAQTGFTTPGYVIASVMAPELNQKQWAVMSTTGTQVGVIPHSGAAPFTLTASQPKQYKVLGKANPTTNVVSNVPMNMYKVGTRKGVLPLAGQPYAIAQAWTTFSVPAGSDTFDGANLRAMTSLHVGALNQQSAGIGDTLISATL